MSVAVDSRPLAKRVSTGSLLLSIVVSVVLCFGTLSCGGGGKSPSGSSGNNPTPTPVPTPTPSGGGNPSAAACPLGPGDLNAECEKTSAKLQGAIMSALDTIVAQQPQIFDKTQEAGTG